MRNNLHCNCPAEKPSLQEIVPLVQPVDGIVFLTSMGEPFTPNHLAGESGWHGTSLSSWR